MKLFDLTGKKALVTGATRGIGHAMAEGLLEAGAETAIVGTSAAAFSTAEKFTQTTGRRAVGIQADLSDREQLQRAFDEAVEKLEGLDILVVNHGINRRHPVEKFPIEDWDLVIETNLTSMFLLNQLAGRLMLAQGQGKIINTASLISFNGGLTIPAYAAAKGGVAQLTKACANEWAGRGVNVNAVVPGYIATDLNLALRQDPERFRRLSERIPAGRWGTPDDLKGVTVFLASAASDYIHGTLIAVDGGWLGY
jgi:2-deoxy-D-gluconate 3-dehydrogenase